MQIYLSIFLLAIPLVLAIIFIHRSSALFHYSSTALLLEFVQTTALFLSFSLTWSGTLLDALNTFSVLNFNADFLAAECAIPGTRSYFSKFTLLLSVPLLVLVTLVAIFVIWKAGAHCLPHPLQAVISVHHKKGVPTSKATVTQFMKKQSTVGNSVPPRNDRVAAYAVDVAPESAKTEEQPPANSVYTPTPAQRKIDVNAITYETIVKLAANSTPGTEEQSQHVAELKHRGLWFCGMPLSCGCFPRGDGKLRPRVSTVRRSQTQEHLLRCFLSLPHLGPYSHEPSNL